MAIAYGNGCFLQATYLVDRAPRTGTDRDQQQVQILGISQDLVVTSTPPNLGKFPTNPVVNRASGGIETPRLNAEQKVTTQLGTTNVAT